MSFFNILRFLEKGNKTIFDCPVPEQQAYIASLGEPVDLKDRSYKQYRCHMYLVPLWKRILQSLASAVLFPVILVVLLIKGFRLKFVEKISAVCDFVTMFEVIPDELVDEFHPDNRHWDESLALKFSDLPFLFALSARYICHPFFVLKTMMKLALYQSIIERFSPEAIIVHNEYSFTSSVLTAYCRNKGICHIDVMHGEKLYYLRDSFFCFDRCYVWAPHYVDLLIRLKAVPEQFRVAVPPSLRINTAAFKNPNVYADVKYYLGYSTEADFISIVESLRPFKEAGMSIKYRLHPRYSNPTVLGRYCAQEEIEDPEKVSIQESVSNMTYAVGSYSTVLLQASLAGKTVILDDVTYCQTYGQLKEMGYILSNKPHHRLSNLSAICHS